MWRMGYSTEFSENSDKQNLRYRVHGSKIVSQQHFLNNSNSCSTLCSLLEQKSSNLIRHSHSRILKRY